MTAFEIDHRGAPATKPPRNRAQVCDRTPARPGRDDGGTRPVAGAYDDHALGAALRTRVREALATVCPGSRPVDETYVKIQVEWCYLYCAVDRAGRTVDVRLSPKRDVAAANAFLRKAVKGQQRAPQTITLDGYAASHRAVRELKADGSLPNDTKLRSSKYLNNLIEQDHRGVKQRIAVMLSFKGFRRAAITLAGIELMHRIRKGQFGLGRLSIQGQTASAVWNAVLAA